MKIILRKYKGEHFKTKRQRKGREFLCAYSQVKIIKPNNDEEKVSRDSNGISREKQSNSCIERQALISQKGIVLKEKKRYRYNEIN